MPINSSATTNSRNEIYSTLDHSDMNQPPPSRQTSTSTPPIPITVPSRGSSQIMSNIPNNYMSLTSNDLHVSANSQTHNHNNNNINHAAHYPNISNFNHSVISAFSPLRHNNSIGEQHQRPQLAFMQQQQQIVPSNNLTQETGEQDLDEPS